MGCCNQAPKGGSNDLGLMFKVLAIVLVVIFILVVLFG